MRKTGPHGDVKLNKSVMHLLHRSGQTVDEMFASIATKIDITPRQLVVLSAIAANPRTSQTAIVEATGIDRSTLAEMVRRLEMRKLIQRKRSKTDARAYVVDLTEQGRRALKTASPLADKVEGAVLEALGRKRLDDLIRSLEQVVSVSLKA